MTNRFLGCLEEGLSRATAEPDPRVAIGAFLSHCAHGMRADRAALYELSLSKSQYSCRWHMGGGIEPAPISLGDEGSSNDSLASIKRYLSGLRNRRSKILSDGTSPIFETTTPAMTLIVPFFNEMECAGFIRFDKKGGTPFDPAEQVFAKSAAVAAFFLLDRSRTLDFLRSSQQPLNFHQTFAEFLDDVVLLIADASGMPYIAVRERVDDGLECIATYGFPSSVPRQDLNLSPLAEYPTFERAVITARSQIEPDMAVDHLATLRATPGLSTVGSFVVVPIKVADGIFGVVSLAARIPYNYSTTEVAAFESIANGIGVAITNYRNFQKVNADVFEVVKANVVYTAVDVAQAARHEARGHLGDIGDRLTLVETYVASGTRSKLALCPGHIEEARQHLNNLNISLDKIKTITKPLERDRRVTDLSDLWENAFALLRGRLENARIDYQVIGKRVELPIFPDILIHVFLNLILNSIDAFVAHGKKSGRRVRATIEDVGDAAADIVMRYMDNASGIDPSRLQPKKDGQQREVTDIFEPGVSSKGGSGYGLYLARNIMMEHKGSLDILDWRNGVVFSIKLPKKPV